jgi:hypothetical protein
MACDHLLCQHAAGDGNGRKFRHLNAGITSLANSRIGFLDH